MAHQCTTCGHLFPDGSKEMLSGCPSCGGNKFQFKPGDVEDFDSDSSASDASSSSSSTAEAGSTPSTPSSTSSTPTDSSPSTPTDQSSSSRADPDSTSSTPTDSSTRSGRREWPETARRQSEPDSSPEYTPWPSQDPSEDADADSSPEPAPGYDAEVVPNDTDSTDGSESPAQSTARSDVASSDDLRVSESRSRRPGQPIDRSSQPDRPDESLSPPAASSSSDNTVHSPTDSGMRTDDSDSADDDSDSADDDSDDATVDQLRRELNEQFESIRIVSPGQYELNLMELYDREEYIISLREDGRYVIEVPDSWSGDSGD